MATMHSLLLGILSLALCITMGITDYSVGSLSPYTTSTLMLNDDINLQVRINNLDVTYRAPSRARESIMHIAQQELGVREASGHNDGTRVEEYLAYTDLAKGYEWCAAFVSWCHGQAGIAQPRNPWSPALFPKAKTHWKQGKKVNGMKATVESADIFGIYSSKYQRINHVGLIKEKQGDYLLSIEGNSNNQVESRRRHLRTIYAISDWID